MNTEVIINLPLLIFEISLKLHSTGSSILGELLNTVYHFHCKLLKGPSQPPPFSMTSKSLIKHGEANSYCFTVSCVPEGMFNYLE